MVDTVNCERFGGWGGPWGSSSFAVVKLQHVGQSNNFNRRTHRVSRCQGAHCPFNIKHH